MSQQNSKNIYETVLEKIYQHSGDNF